MAKRKIAVQVKNTAIGSPVVQQLAGATSGKHGPGTTLIIDGKSVSKSAVVEAARIEETTGMKIKFWNILDRG